MKTLKTIIEGHYNPNISKALKAAKKHRKLSNDFMAKARESHIKLRDAQLELVRMRRNSGTASKNSRSDPTKVVPPTNPKVGHDDMVKLAHRYRKKAGLSTYDFVGELYSHPSAPTSANGQRVYANKRGISNFLKLARQTKTDRELESAFADIVNKYA